MPPPPRPFPNSNSAICRQRQNEQRDTLISGKAPEQHRDTQLARAHAELAAGHISSAIGHLTSKGLLPVSGDVIVALRKKYPYDPSLQLENEPKLDRNCDTPPIFTADTRHYIATTRRQTACGYEALSFEELQDIIDYGTVEPYDDTPRALVVANSLTMLINDIANGLHDHPSTRAVLTHLRGVALIKKEGSTDPRPIGIGAALVNVTTGCLLRDETMSKRIANLVGPTELALGRRGGGEALPATIEAAHRVYPNLVIAGTDIENAFNSLSRQAILREGCKQLPEFAPLIRMLYGHSNTVTYTHSITEASIHLTTNVGVTQGCVLSMLLFSICLRVAVEATLKQHPTLIITGYADDRYLLGEPHVVAKGLTTYGRELARLGLRLQVKKSVVIMGSIDPAVRAAAEAIFMAMHQLPISEGFVACGVPIGSPAYMESALTKAFDDHVAHIEYLEPFFRHLRTKPGRSKSIYTIIRLCLAPAKIMYLLRTLPESPLLRTLIKKYDAATMKMALLALHLSPGDSIYAPTPGSRRGNLTCARIQVSAACGGCGIVPGHVYRAPARLGHIGLVAAIVYSTLQRLSKEPPCITTLFPDLALVADPAIRDIITAAQKELDKGNAAPLQPAPAPAGAAPLTTVTSPATPAAPAATATPSSSPASPRAPPTPLPPTSGSPPPTAPLTTPQQGPPTATAPPSAAGPPALPPILPPPPARSAGSTPAPSFTFAGFTVSEDTPLVGVLFRATTKDKGILKEQVFTLSGLLNYNLRKQEGARIPTLIRRVCNAEGRPAEATELEIAHFLSGTRHGADWLATTSFLNNDSFAALVRYRLGLPGTDTTPTTGPCSDCGAPLDATFAPGHPFCCNSKAPGEGGARRTATSASICHAINTAMARAAKRAAALFGKPALEFIVPTGCQPKCTDIWAPRVGAPPPRKRREATRLPETTREEEEATSPALPEEPGDDDMGEAGSAADEAALSDCDTEDDGAPPPASPAPLPQKEVIRRADLSYRHFRDHGSVFAADVTLASITPSSLKATEGRGSAQVPGYAAHQAFLAKHTAYRKHYALELRPDTFFPIALEPAGFQNENGRIFYFNFLTHMLNWIVGKDPKDPTRYKKWEPYMVNFRRKHLKYIHDALADALATSAGKTLKLYGQRANGTVVGAPPPDPRPPDALRTEEMVAFLRSCRQSRPPEKRQRRDASPHPSRPGHAATCPSPKLSTTTSASPAGPPTGGELQDAGTTEHAPPLAPPAPPAILPPAHTQAIGTAPSPTTSAPVLALAPPLPARRPTRWGFLAAPSAPEPAHENRGRMQD